MNNVLDHQKRSVGVHPFWFILLAKSALLILFFLLAALSQEVLPSYSNRIGALALGVFGLYHLMAPILTAILPRTWPRLSDKYPNDRIVETVERVFRPFGARARCVTWTPVTLSGTRFVLGTVCICDPEFERLSNREQEFWLIRSLVNKPEAMLSLMHLVGGLIFVLGAGILVLLLDTHIPSWVLLCYLYLAIAVPILSIAAAIFLQARRHRKLIQASLEAAGSLNAVLGFLERRANKITEVDHRKQALAERRRADLARQYERFVQKKNGTTLVKG